MVMRLKMFLLLLIMTISRMGFRLAPRWHVPCQPTA